MAATDALFGIHGQALAIQSRRMELIASNLANADTPGFQARDLDFREVLAQVSQPAAGTGVVDNPSLKYRVAGQPSTDGNTVDVQTEQAQYAEAALRYQASLGFLDGRIKAMMTALTGQ